MSALSAGNCARGQHQFAVDCDQTHSAIAAFGEIYCGVQIVDHDETPQQIFDGWLEKVVAGHQIGGDSTHAAFLQNALGFFRRFIDTQIVERQKRGASGLVLFQKTNRGFGLRVAFANQVVDVGGEGNFNRLLQFRWCAHNVSNEGVIVGQLLLFNSLQNRTRAAANAFEVLLQFAQRFQARSRTGTLFARFREFVSRLRVLDLRVLNRVARALDFAFRGFRFGARRFQLVARFGLRNVGVLDFIVQRR